MMKNVEDRVQALLNAALVLFSDGELSLALPLLQKALEIAPERAELQVLLGHIRRQQGAFQEAEQAFRRALQLDPGNYEAAQGLGLLLLQQNRFHEAQPYLEKCLKQRPEDLVTLRAYMQTLMQTGETQKAEPFFKKAWKEAASLGLAIEYVRFLIYQGQLERALELIDRALHELSLLPKERVRLLAEKALIYTIQDKHDQVIQVLHEALSLDETFDRAWRGLAYSYARRGDIEKAVEASERALALNPQHYRNWQARADVLLMANRPEEALDAVERGLELADPQDPEAIPVRKVLYLQKAAALLAKGQEEEALKAFVEARTEFPKDWRFYIYPMQLLYMKGDLEEALHILQEAQSHFDLREKKDDLIILGINLYPHQARQFYQWLKALRDMIGESSRLLNALGFTALGEGDLDIAEESWQKALKSAETPEDRLMTLVDLLYLYILQRQWDKAIQSAKVAQSLMKQADSSVEAYLRIAFFFQGRIVPDYAPHPKRSIPLKVGLLANQMTLELAQGHLNKARSTLTKLKRIFGGDAPLVLELEGTFHAACSETEKAIASWEKALKVLAEQPEANREEATMVEQWIASLKGV